MKQIKNPTLAIAAILFAIAATLPIPLMSFGAQGSDAPAYIFLTERIAHNQDLIFQDPTQHNIRALNEDTIAQLALPKQYEYDEQQDLQIHRYPIGLPLLLSIGSIVAQKPIGLYIMYVFISILAVPLVYLVTLELLSLSKASSTSASEWRSRQPIALLAALFTLTNTTVFAYIIGPPSRDLPLLTFILATIYVLLQLRKTTTKALMLSILAGILMTITVSIRDTAVLFFPLYLWMILYNAHATPYAAARWKTISGILYAALLSGIAFLGIHYLVDGTFVSLQHLISPQSQHVSSLSVDNTLSAKGQYQRGISTVYSFFQYQFMHIFSTPYAALVTIVLGIATLWKKRSTRDTRLLCGMLLLWFLPYFGLFSLWTNAYPRYLLPVLPVTILLSVLTIEPLFAYLKKKKLVTTAPVMVSVICLFFVGVHGRQLMTLAQTPEIFHYKHFERSFTYADYTEIETLREEITAATAANTTGKRQPMIITDKKGIREFADVIEAHTQILTTPIIIKHFNDTQHLNALFDAYAKEHNIIILSDDLGSLSQHLDEQYVLSDTHRCTFTALQHCEWATVQTSTQQ